MTTTMEQYEIDAQIEEWMVCDVRQKYNDDFWARVAIDLNTWDEWTPEQRYEYVVEQIKDQADGRVDGYTILASNDGDFERSYYPRWEIKFTVAELKANGMLKNQIEAYGCVDFEQLVCELGLDESDGE